MGLDHSHFVYLCFIIVSRISVNLPRCGCPLNSPGCRLMDFLSNLQSFLKWVAESYREIRRLSTPTKTRPGRLEILNTFVIWWKFDDFTFHFLPVIMTSSFPDFSIIFPKTRIFAWDETHLLWEVIFLQIIALYERIIIDSSRQILSLLCSGCFQNSGIFLRIYIIFSESTCIEPNLDTL